MNGVSLFPCLYCKTQLTSLLLILLARWLNLDSEFKLPWVFDMSTNSVSTGFWCFQTARLLFSMVHTIFPSHSSYFKLSLLCSNFLLITIFSHLQQMNALSTSLRRKSRAKMRFSSVSFFDLYTLIFVYFHSLFSFLSYWNAMKWPLTQEFTLKCMLDLIPFCSCHSLLQRTFPTQGLNWGLPHCRQILYYLSHQGSCMTLLLLFSCPGMSDFLWALGLQHTRFPCPSVSPGLCSNSCPLSRWCHPAISSSVAPFSSCP